MFSPHDLIAHHHTRHSLALPLRTSFWVSVTRMGISMVAFPENFIETDVVTTASKEFGRAREMDEVRV